MKAIAVNDESNCLTYNPARFDLVTLHLVVACIETGTLSSAARRFNLVPGAASRRIRELEYTLGCRLFTRNAKGMSPTSAGETLLPHALALLQQLDCMLGDFALIREKSH